VKGSIRNCGPIILKERAKKLAGSIEVEKGASESRRAGTRSGLAKKGFVVMGGHQARWWSLICEKTQKVKSAMWGPSPGGGRKPAALRVGQHDCGPPPAVFGKPGGPKRGLAHL